jgi:hypothetical protein
MAKKGRGKSIVFLILSSIISVVLLLIVALNIALSLNVNRELPDVFGFAPVIISNDMLAPEICKDDIVFMRTSDAAKIDIESGEYVAFRFDGVLLVEPVVGRERAIYILKNDTELDRDSFEVRQNDILGVYSKKIPKAGAVFAFSRTSFGVALFLLVPAILFFVYFFVMKGRAGEEKRGKSFNFN